MLRDDLTTVQLLTFARKALSTASWQDFIIMRLQPRLSTSFMTLLA